MALYDRIGIGYDTTRRVDPYLLSRLLHHLEPSAGARYLDVGCGTGNYTIAMSQAGVSICGVDLSPTMLAQARDKPLLAEWVRGDVLALPFRDASFAGATMTFVHHHVSDRVAGFREIRRVLGPSGKLVLLNGTAEQTRHFWLVEYFPRAIEQAASSCSQAGTEATLAEAGFSIKTIEVYEVADDLKDRFLYSGKHRPELYLDPRVRAGISAFACAHDQNEIDQGVERLTGDICTGQISSVIHQYGWAGGDYTFTVAAR